MLTRVLAPLRIVFAAAIALLTLSHLAIAQQFNIGDRVHVRSMDDDGVVMEILGPPMGNGGVLIKVRLDKRGITMPFDTVASGITALGGGDGANQMPQAPAALPPPAGSQPQGAAPPQQQVAQGGQCTVGQRVAVPAGYKDQWYQAVVIAVDPSKPYPCRVHPLGYASTEEQSFAPSMMRDPSAATLPIGADSTDPYLTGGQQPAKPARILPGSYECYTGTGGALHSAMGENFTILDGSNYRDTAGAAGTYRFDAASGTVAFQGGALNGQRGVYQQPSTPPIKNRPPTVTIQASGDACDLKM